MSRERYVDIPGDQARVKFKLDENLGPASAAALLEAGFDVVTVSDQRLEGALDRHVIECCVREGVRSESVGRFLTDG